MADILTDVEAAALRVLPRHGSRYEIDGAIGRDARVKDPFASPGAYDRRILLVSLRSALSAVAINAAHIERQRAFSLQTYGPGTRTKGVIAHIRKELVEIEAAPLDLSEWVDVIILAFDGAWRAGHEPQAIIDAIVAKQTRNEGREWPDWRTAAPDTAIEHVRICRWVWNEREMEWRLGGAGLPCVLDGEHVAHTP